jgi:hypothetical protein
MPSERIREADLTPAAKALLRNAWSLFVDAYLMQQTPDEIKRSQAYASLDKKLRELKVIGQ